MHPLGFPQASQNSAPEASATAVCASIVRGAVRCLELLRLTGLSAMLSASRANGRVFFMFAFLVASLPRAHACTISHAHSHTSALADGGYGASGAPLPLYRATAAACHAGMKSCDG